MKVSNWHRKLAASLVAGGLFTPAAAQAANLDTNLVVNGTFENVDLGVTGDYGAPKVLQWSGFDGFAYSHQPGTTGIPDYADGADPPGAGLWYFTTNNNPLETDFNDPGDFYQDINVATGATSTQIASGEAAVRIRADMSSYANDTDFGNVHVDFRNSGGTSLGTAIVSDSDPGSGNVWSLNSGAAFVPVGTATLRVSLFGTRTGGGPGADGYIDNVDVQVTNAANELLFLHVNTANGQVAVKNQTGDPVHLDYYEITSADSALNKTAWTSLQDRNLAGFPAGNGTGNGWEEIGVTGPKVLSEAFLTGNSLVSNGASIGLGGAFNVGGAHDLVFRYSVVPELPLPLRADFEPDGDVDGRDFLTWQRGFGKPIGALSTEGDADGDGNIDADDYDIWATEFGGPSGRGKLVTGFLHYAPTGPITAVPEPAAIILAGMGLAPVGIRRARSRHRP